MAVYRRATVRRPYNSPVGGVGETDGEVVGVSAFSRRVEAAGEGRVWRDEEDFPVIYSQGCACAPGLPWGCTGAQRN